MARIRDVCTLEINNYQEGKKLKISPAKEFKGLDGRLFTLNNSALERTKEQGVDIHINVEHGFTSTFNNQAVGWIALDSLEFRDDGIYALVNLNEDGKKLVQSKAYRYLSPEFIINQKREVITIEAVALTNRPNLKLEINKKDDKVNKNETQESTVSELNQKVESLQSELNSKDKTIASLQSELKEQAFNAALKEGKVTPAQKEFADSLELNQLKSWLSSLKAAPHLDNLDVDGKDGKDGKEDNEKELNDFAQKVNW